MNPAQQLQVVIPGIGRILKRFSPYIRKQQSLITLSMLALFGEIALRLLEPLPLKFIFDELFVQQAGGAVLHPVPLIGALDTRSLLLLCAIAIVALAGIRGIAAYWSTVGFALAGNRVLTEIRSVLYTHLQTLSLSFYSRTRSGDLTLRVISDVAVLQEVVVTALLPLLANCLILLGMVGVMFWLNAQLAILGLTLLPIFWFSTFRLTQRIRAVSKQQRQREGSMAATAAESIGAIKLVQALSLQDKFTTVFTHQNQKSLKEGVKAKRLSAQLERTVEVLLATATALVLWRGAELVLRNALTPGDLLVFLTYLKNAFKPVRDFAKYIGRLAKASAAGDRILDLLDQAPDIYDLPEAKPAPRLAGAVQFDNVSFAYEPGYSVLQDISFTVKPGQRVAIVGYSGSGKSTLTTLLLRLYEPDQGTILIDNQDIRRYTLESLRTQMSVVLQDSLLFAASVWDNIAYGASTATEADVIAAAKLANAHEFILNLPQGYDTILGERGVTLSGGQRQRLSIARAAIRQAPILILDEPTTGLDKANEQEVIDALERLSVGRTTFLIVHDLELAARADFIFYMERGRLVERGTHEALMQLNDRYAALYRLQATERQYAAASNLECSI
ncbi:ABC transporter ATP-binding protein [Leptolyngbya boryana NIES-2135]|jgi:ATP-binding cassette subfamily B protein|uniref:ABC transporter ATP-binding protein n=1 Tax=Leptolyngbya boryana NIES-2135 TaxID=1973484 RepID=A0A1Z4JNI6_LEPBY|nr:MULTISPECIES: ABC transporter ATP-binding protein [Leptolyngbya]BAY58321.1 ABC transporter ATP-binding protein [Leptolyngbya boryana NIES-2135]MBD2367997.1 ABC transporter ATP-binding protein [Leptolyngbya sp. FACHB-161]MBD2374521.1 ABC transporter ATP-binding protein [Leptolyngbya sp. FACHB-238]MBD2398943.1 ABC transporter ATP-binding protein [Leptolyngbya sp. FACHB-239]MBD2405344.1 ABC transporter ATP-binding protein [Leptolyngbya sp. FACHB-402]